MNTLDREVHIRKKDGKVFLLLEVKHFTMNLDVKETGQKFGIPFDMDILQSYDGEIDIQMSSSMIGLYDKIDLIIKQNNGQ